MKKSGLRGMLLGVSLALLLAGGVALAQALTLTVDQDCFECWPAAAAGPDEEHIVVVTLDDYDDEADLYFDLYINGKLYGSDYFGGEYLSAAPCEIRLWADCGQLGLHFDTTCELAGGATAGLLDARVANGPVEYGEWVFRAWQGQNGGPVAQVAFTFAAVCEEEVVEEFVPEPGTIALLGSGLAGLAGYATLRWRARS